MIEHVLILCEPEVNMLAFRAGRRKAIRGRKEADFEEGGTKNTL
jgi:hypothetical protein